MANNTDLISEINGVLQSLANAREDKENAAGLSFGEYVDDLEDDIELISLAGLTLQRARDALRWIPCEERLPEKPDLYDTSYGDDTSVLWFDGRAFHGDAQAWRERPTPYTPEEK